MDIFEELSLVGLAHSLEWLLGRVRLRDLEVFCYLQTFLFVGWDDSEDVRCSNGGRCNVSVCDFLRVSPCSAEKKIIVL
jgi:hypothetical protein